jgi:hypothetical protein
MTRKEIFQAEWRRTRRWLWGGIILLFASPLTVLFIVFFLQANEKKALRLLDFSVIAEQNIAILTLLPACYLALTLLGCRFFYRIEQLQEDNYPNVPASRLLAAKLHVLTRQSLIIIAIYIALLSSFFPWGIDNEVWQFGACFTILLPVLPIFSALIGLAVRNIFISTLIALPLAALLVMAITYDSALHLSMWVCLPGLLLHSALVCGILLLALYVLFCRVRLSRFAHWPRAVVIVLSAWTFVEIYASTITADLNNLIFLWFGG